MKFLSIGALVAFATQSLAEPITEVKLFCPKGFERIDEETCKKTLKRRPRLTCPKGFKKVKKMDEVRCLKKTFFDPVPECRPGFELTDEGNACKKRKEFPVVVVCPPGFTDNGSECERTRMEPATPFCPKGQGDLVDGKCLLQERPKPRCPDGTTLNTDTNKCEEKKTEKPKTKCEPGFKFDADGRCFKDERAPTIPKCLRGKLNPDTGKCEERIERPPEEKCPEGTVEIDDKCFLIKPVDVSCPPKFVIDPKDDDYCLGRKVTPAKRVCPAIERDGECFKIEKEKPQPKCPDKFELFDGKVCRFCQDKDKKRCKYVRPTFECPKGFYLKDKYCFRKVPVPFEFECDSGTLKKEGDKYICVEPLRIPSKKDCPKGFTRRGDKCFQERPPVLFCNRPFQLVNGRVCVYIKISLPVPTCNPPYKLSDDKKYCVRRVYGKVIPFCEDPFELENGKCCFTKETLPIFDVCREGFTFNPQSKMCEKKSKPLLKCRDDTWVLRNGKCFKKETEPRVLKCRRDDQTLDEENEICFKVFIRKPKLVCEDGTRVRDKCVLREYEDVTAECKKGFELVGKYCIRVIFQSPRPGPGPPSPKP